MIASRWLIVAAVILAGQTAEAQQPATLTLACKGTAAGSSDDNSEPVSMGVIINFTVGTVQGLMDYSPKIIATNDVTVSFGGSQENIFSVSGMRGSIDRITGDLEATFTFYDMKTRKMLNRRNFALQPAQRMF
jgi:hypothetical protein